jgi:hypothetical protein
MTPNLGIFASQISGHLAAPSSFYNIATLTPTSGTIATFSSIPQTYSSLQIRILVQVDAGGAGGTNAIFVRPNGLSSTSNYTSHWLYGDGTTAGAGGAATGSYSGVLVGGIPSNTTNNFGTSIVDIHQYTSSYSKTIRYISGANSNGAYTNRLYMGSGLSLDTGAISSIDIYTNGSPFISGTTIALYGVK